MKALIYAAAFTGLFAACNSEKKDEMTTAAAEAKYGTPDTIVNENGDTQWWVYKNSKTIVVVKEDTVREVMSDAKFDSEWDRFKANARQAAEEMKAKTDTTLEDLKEEAKEIKADMKEEKQKAEDKYDEKMHKLKDKKSEIKENS